MISEGVDINCQDKLSRTGLMEAMSNGSNKVVRILLGCNNIKIDISNKNGWTALLFMMLVIITT